MCDTHRRPSVYGEEVNWRGLGDEEDRDLALQELNVA